MMFSFIKENLKVEKLLVLGAFCLLGLLLFKNPFSERTLVPNLEPYPDTIHYLNPPLSLLNGKKMLIEREGRYLIPAVPPLYSTVMLPFFIIKKDVRLFYFANIALSFISLILFYKIINIIFKKNIFLIGVLLFFYVTNYFIYWYPTLAMAENLILPICLAGLLLFILPLKKSSFVLFGILPISLYATKYASIPLAVSFLGLYMFKILNEIEGGRKKIKALLVFIFVGLVTFGILGLFEYFVKGSNIFSPLANSIRPFISLDKESLSTGRPSSSYFSRIYFVENLKTYFGAITGKSMRFLWDGTAILPNYIAMVSITGIVVGLFKKGFRFISLSLGIVLISAIVFLSFFYISDARYIYQSIPILLIGFGLFLFLLLESAKKPYIKIFAYVLLVVIFCFYSTTNFTRLRKQISLNLKYAETPWYYMSVKTANEYFASLNSRGEKPILISALPPFYVDFFSNKKYELLPLSKNQEFPRIKEVVWGTNDYSDLTKLYRQYLGKRSLYVSNHALGNEQYLHDDFNLIKDNFKLTEVKKGCFDTCNIYKVELKDE